MGNVWFATMRPTFLLDLLGAELEQVLDPYLDLTWWMGHPLGFAIAIFTLLVIAQAVLGLFSYLIKQLLLWLVKSPYLLFQWLLNQTSVKLDLPLPRSFIKQQATVPVGTDKQAMQEQLLVLLQQLESSKQEQEQILQALKQLLMAQQTSTLL